MHIHEYQSKSMLRTFGVPVPSTPARLGATLAELLGGQVREPLLSAVG